jgi:hypothetical protein
MAVDAHKAMRRARRAARTLKDGEAILARLQEDDARALLLEAVEDEMPSVAKVSTMLLAGFGQPVKQLPVRQFVGMAVKAVMAEEGYAPIETGVRIPGDPVFTTGAVYGKVEESEEQEAEDDILRTMIAALSASQKRRLAEMLEE